MNPKISAKKHNCILQQHHINETSRGNTRFLIVPHISFFQTWEFRLYAERSKKYISSPMIVSGNIALV